MRQLLLLTTLLAGPAFADDAALLIGIERYADLDRVRDGSDIVEAAGPLARFGFQTFAEINPDTDDVFALADRFAAQTSDAERLIVGLSGRFATDDSRTWFLTQNPTGASKLSAMNDSLHIGLVLDVMAQAQGQAILVLGHDGDDDDLVAGITQGIGRFDDIPQGVMVVIGAPDDAADYVSDIAQPGADAAAIASADRDLRVFGFAPRSLIMIPEATTEEPNAAPQTADTAAEDALWDGTQALDTADAYLDYLSKYPNGQYTEQAQAQLDVINSEPNRQDRLAEDALSLTRAQRRDIQRDLTLLDYNTRGIDGIFGPGTRQAITNWQQQAGFAQTSYLSIDQINQLDAQAARRAAELEAEAARVRAAEERRDRAFWQETGAAGDEAGYRAYLERFPDGLFTSEARSRLDTIEASQRAVAETEDKAGWDRARSIDTIPGYREYLAAFEEGEFRRAARDRIKEIRREAQDAEALEDAEATEIDLNVDRVTARLIEAKLASLGLDPGPADGEFTQDTRRALRIYQRDRDLPPSGFLDRGTVSRLLADTLESISR